MSCGEGERSTRFKIGGFVVGKGGGSSCGCWWSGKALGTGPRNSDGQIRFKRTGTVADKEAREREQLKGRAGRRERMRE